MLPITNLPDRLEQYNASSASSFYRLRTGRTRQAKPFSIPTRYVYIGINNIDAKVWGKTWAQSMATNATQDISPWQLRACWSFHGSPWSDAYDGPGGVYAAEAVNYAREKFLDKLSDRSEWLVNLAERKAAVDMIADRAGRLLRFAKRLQDYDRRFGGASKSRHPNRTKVLAIRGILGTLGRVMTPKGWHPRQLSRDASALWLELHFGWEPLVKDIYNAVNVLQLPAKANHLTVKGKRVPIRVEYSTSTDKASVVGEVQAFMSAQVEVTDPNLWLANNLGLVNPATVAWELVPFSFVVDWFVNVGQFLGQYSSFYGAKVTNGCYGWKTSITHSMTSVENWYPFPGESVTSAGQHYRRIVGLPSVKLVVKTFRGISVTRGATAISLLVQQGIKPLAR